MDVAPPVIATSMLDRRRLSFSICLPHQDSGGCLAAETAFSGGLVRLPAECTPVRSADFAEWGEP